MTSKVEIARNWLPRYTGTKYSDFADWILLTNFHDYVHRFANRFGCDIQGEDGPMTSATCDEGLSIINFGIGAPNAATIMDLLVAANPRGVLFLGKVGGLCMPLKVGDLVMPRVAIRAEGASDAYIDPSVPAVPTFKLQKYLSNAVLAGGHAYTTGMIYTTSRRVWEWDHDFRDKLEHYGATAIDMETATIYTVGHVNRIPRAALHLVSDMPLMQGGIKTAHKDHLVTKEFANKHLDVAIDAMLSIDVDGEEIIPDLD